MAQESLKNKKLTASEIATLKIFSAYASKAGDKPGSKRYKARLADLTSNISYEIAATKRVPAPNRKSSNLTPAQQTAKSKDEHATIGSARNATIGWNKETRTIRVRGKERIAVTYPGRFGHDARLENKEKKRLDATRESKKK